MVYAELIPTPSITPLPAQPQSGCRLRHWNVPESNREKPEVSVRRPTPSKRPSKQAYHAGALKQQG